jgi:hypothetical protein
MRRKVGKIGGRTGSNLGSADQNLRAAEVIQIIERARDTWQRIV